MPRNITVSFDDGTSHVYNNVPDDITPDQVYSRASNEFTGLKVTNIDGGRKSDRTTVGEDIEIGLKGAAKQVLSGTNLVVGGAADIAGNMGIPGAENLSKRLQRGLDISRAEINQSMADISGKEQGVGGKIISAVPQVGAAIALGTPGMIASAVGSGAEQQQTLLDMGVDEDTAALSGATTGALNLVGMKFNPLVGGGAVKAVTTGAGVNVGQSLLQNYINRGLLQSAGYDEQAKMFENRAEDLTADAIVGAAFGAYGKYKHAKGVKKAEEAKAASDIILNRLKSEREAANAEPPVGEMVAKGGVSSTDTDAIDAQLARARNPYFKSTETAVDDLGIPYNKAGSEEINKLVNDSGFQKLFNKWKNLNDWATDYQASGGELNAKDKSELKTLREQVVEKVKEYGLTGKDVDATWGKRTAKEFVPEGSETLGLTEQTLRDKNAVDVFNADAQNKVLLDEYNTLKSRWDNGDLPDTTRLNEVHQELQGRINQINKSTEPVKTGVAILDTAANKQQAPTVADTTAPVTKGETIKSILGDKLGAFTDAPADPAQVKAAIAKEADIDVGKGSRTWDQIISGAQFKAAETKNTLIKAVKSAYDMAVHRGNKLAEDEVRPLEQTIAKLTPEERALGIDLILSTEGSKQYTRAELQKAGVPESVINVMETWYSASAKALKAVNEARAAKGLEPIESRAGYFPSRWSGQYGLEVRGKNGELITMLRGHSQKEMEQARQFMAKSNPEYSFGEVTRRNLRDPNFQQADKFYGLHELLDTVGKNDPNVDLVLKAYNEYLNKSGTNLFGLRKHELDKAGIKGFEGAKAYKSREDNAIEGWKSALEYLDQSFKYSEVNKGMIKANELMASPEAAHQVNAKRYLQDYLDTNLGKPTGLSKQINAVADTIMEYAGRDMKTVYTAQKVVQDWMHLTKMGLSLPFLFTQAVQPFAVLPEFALHMRQAGVSDTNMLSGMASAWKMFGGGMSNILSSSYVPNRRLDVSKFSPEAQPYVKFAQERGVVGSSLMHDIRTLGESKALSNVKQAAAGTQNMLESSSRLYTFFMYSKALEASGMPRQQAMETAGNITKMAMVDYSSHEKSLMLNKGGVVGQSFGNLKTFVLNSISRGSFHFKHGKNTGDFKPFAAYLMMQMAVGGVTGVIGFAEADELVKAISTMLGKPTSISGLVHRNLPEWAEFGALSSMLGVDLSSRFQSKVLPITEEGIDWKNIFPTISLPVGQVAEVGKFLAEPTTVQGMRTARSVSPAAFTGAIEERPTFYQGDMALSPTKGTGIIERTPDEKILNKLTGLKSVEEASMKSGAFEGARMVRKNEEAKKSLVDKAINQIDSGGISGDKMSEYIQKYAELNAGDVKPFLNAIQYHMQSRNLTIEQNVEGIPSNTGKSLSRYQITQGTK